MSESVSKRVNESVRVFVVLLDKGNPHPRQRLTTARLIELLLLVLS